MTKNTCDDVANFTFRPEAWMLPANLNISLFNKIMILTSFHSHRRETREMGRIETTTTQCRATVHGRLKWKALWIICNTCTEPGFLIASVLKFPHHFALWSFLSSFIATRVSYWETKKFALTLHGAEEDIIEKDFDKACLASSAVDDGCLRREYDINLLMAISLLHLGIWLSSTISAYSLRPLLLQWSVQVSELSLCFVFVFFEKIHSLLALDHILLIFGMGCERRFSQVH